MSDTVMLGGPIRRIAIMRALFLGDLLCTTPAFRALRQRFPQAEITLIGLPWAEEFVARSPALDRFLPFLGYPGIIEGPRDPALTAAFLAEARAYRYDLAIQMHGNGQSSNGFVADLGARVTLGYRRDEAADARLTRSMPYVIGEHETRRWTRLVAPLGTRADSSPRLDLTVLPGDAARAAPLFGPMAACGPLIGLHVGAKEDARRWPIAHFAALADHLVARYAARIVLTGSEGERALTEAVRRAMSVPFLDLTGRTDLGQFAATIATLDLLVTNDTGASHVAAATGTRSVVLFGPSRPQEWAPLDRERHIPVDALAFAGAGDDPVAALQRLPTGPVMLACIAQLAALSFADTSAGAHGLLPPDGELFPATPGEVWHGV